MIQRQRQTPEQAFQKIKHYCAYQERCHQEAKEKLYSLGLGKKDVEELIARLIEENYLNEERYAIQFAGGRFRMKQWGRVKIRYELKQRQIGEYNIKKALAAIPGDDYEKTLDRLVERKAGTLQEEENPFARQRKLQDYLMQKGYEPDLIQAVIKKLPS